MMKMNQNLEEFKQRIAIYKQQHQAKEARKHRVRRYSMPVGESAETIQSHKLDVYLRRGLLVK